MSPTRTATHSVTDGLPTSATPGPSSPAPTANPAFSQGPAATSTSPPSPPLPTYAATSSPDGAIAGGVVGGLAVIALLIIAVLYLHRRKPAKPPPATDANSDALQLPPPGLMAENDYPTASLRHVVYNHHSFISEMPGSIPDKTAWGRDIHGGGGCVPTEGNLTPGYDGVEHRQVGGVSPLEVEGHVVQGHNGVDYGQGAGRDEGADIV